jgi:flagellar motor switch protein FliM
MDDHDFRVFENRILRKLFRHKYEEVRRGWRKIASFIIVIRKDLDGSY